MQFLTNNLLNMLELMMSPEEATLRKLHSPRNLSSAPRQLPLRTPREKFAKHSDWKIVKLGLSTTTIFAARGLWSTLILLNCQVRCEYGVSAWFTKIWKAYFCNNLTGQNLQVEAFWPGGWNHLSVFPPNRTQSVKFILKLTNDTQMNLDFWNGRGNSST